jgi:hypothetical protein
VRERRGEDLSGRVGSQDRSHLQQWRYACGRLLHRVRQFMLTLAMMSAFDPGMEILTMIVWLGSKYAKT